MRIGAQYQGEGVCEFTVWAPELSRVEVSVVSPVSRLIPMSRDEWGYWRARAEEIWPGTTYFYRLEGNVERPDPASQSQPEGVHGPSAVVDHAAFRWTDENWAGVALADLIIYELHVGTFTREGTFAAVIDRLAALLDLGVTAIEIMPVAQFPGSRNWGYDGVYPFAVQHSYGGVDGLKRLVDAAHNRGLAVFLDVVYNHLGPEGNYLESFAPYFTDRLRTPWGKAINFDEAWSDGVRNYYLENALYYLREFHLDGLRLDAIDTISSHGARPFLQELGEVVAAYEASGKRRIHLIAESALNDPRVIRPPQAGGYGLDAQWSDDFHHSLHTLLTGERQGYYEDFGRIEDLVKAYREGFVYTGEYSPYRRRRHGASSAEDAAERFVVCAQNHDQVGNRMLGERLSSLVSFEALKLAAGAVLLSPFLPLLFMGEEYGEEAPFLYFVSHGDADLCEAVRCGRRAEFAAFNWQGEPPDPVAVETFERSKLDWSLRQKGHHMVLLDFYRRLIHLRRAIPALANLSKRDLEVAGDEERRLICWQRRRDESRLFCAMNLNLQAVTLEGMLPEGEWLKLIDSADETWLGPGSTLPSRIDHKQEVEIAPQSIVIFERE